MRRLLVRVSAALAAATVVVATAAPARAGDEPEWKRIACTSGTIDRAELSGDGRLLTLEGRLDCADTSAAPAAYGYARYYGEGIGVVSEPELVPYESTAPTRYARLAELVSTDFAVCLVTDYGVRVACLKVEGKQPATTVRPLPIDDPLVTMKVRIVRGDAMGSPACGGCW